MAIYAASRRGRKRHILYGFAATLQSNRTTDDHLSITTPEVGYAFAYGPTARSHTFAKVRDRVFLCAALVVSIKATRIQAYAGQQTGSITKLACR